MISSCHKRHVRLGDEDTEDRGGGGMADESKRFHPSAVWSCPPSQLSSPQQSLEVHAVIELVDRGIHHVLFLDMRNKSVRCRHRLAKSIAPSELIKRPVLSAETCPHLDMLRDGFVAHVALRTQHVLRTTHRHGSSHIQVCHDNLFVVV